MATITDPEALQILDQLARIQTQLTEKQNAADISGDLNDIRTDISTEATAIESAIDRLINIQAKLNDLEDRVRALE
jgi:hypothetical protein